MEVAPSVSDGVSAAFAANWVPLSEWAVPPPFAAPFVVMGEAKGWMWCRRGVEEEEEEGEDGLG